MIIELWDSIKPFINSKDRLNAADAMVAIFDEYGFSDGLEFEHGLDKHLNAAVISYYGLDEETTDDDDEGW
jgi:hypothetical protein